jgi:hypothetical protein
MWASTLVLQLGYEPVLLRGRQLASVPVQPQGLLDVSESGLHYRLGKPEVRPGEARRHK